MVKIGINGFGRLGRLLLKVAINKSKQPSAADSPRVVMVNDPSIPTDKVPYLIQNDSFYGRYPYDIVDLGNSLQIDGQKIIISREANVDKIPWNTCSTDYIIDTTGKNSSCRSASKFLTEGIKRVIVTGCDNIPMFVYGVNHACFDMEMKTLSAATPSMNCLMILLRVLHENFEIKEAMATSMHPFQTKDKILDDTAPGNARDSRSALSSFAPTRSRTQRKFVDKIMPELEGKTESAAIRLPVPCVGAVDLTVKFNQEASMDIIKCRLKDASESYMKGILGIVDDDLISTDLIGNGNSCVVDAKAGVTFSKCMSKLFAWYDSEYAFASRLYDLASYISSRENCAK